MAQELKVNNHENEGLVDVVMQDYLNEGQKSYVPTIPRINGAMLMSKEFVRKEISIIGKFQGCSMVNKNILNFKASDGIKFNTLVNISDEINEWKGFKSNYIEIRGIVQENNNILLQNYTEYGNNLNFKLWNEFVILTHQYPQLF